MLGVFTSCLLEVYEKWDSAIIAGVPLFHVGSNQLITDRSSAFSFGSADQTEP